MLKVVVVDVTAEARNSLVELVSQFLNSQLHDLNFIPRVSLQPLSPQELKFYGTPDICIVGDVLVTKDLTELRGIRKLLPGTPIMVRTSPALENLSSVEQLARMGADDTITSTMSGAEFLRKLVLLARKSGKARNGKLILVDAGKGGLGVTSVVAGLGDALAAHGKRVLTIDLDMETQDLSRFLQTPPFVNENLQLLLEEQRPITQEFVEQCVSQVWDDEDLLFNLAPCQETDAVYDPRSSYARSLLSVLEILDATYDAVIVDMAGVRGAILRTLYRVADRVVYLVSNDPASLYACVDKLVRVRGWMAADAELCVIENTVQKNGLSNKLLRQEFTRASKIQEIHWANAALPWSSQGARWPGSGGTLFSQGSPSTRKAFHLLLQKLQLVEAGEIRDGLSDRLSGLVKRLKRRKDLAIPLGDVGATRSDASANLAAAAPMASLPKQGSQPLLTNAASPNLALVSPAEMEASSAPARASASTPDLEKSKDDTLVSGATFS